MKKFKSSGQSIVLGIFALIALCIVVYGCYWVIKHISYNLMYEDMVRETIIEMVKQRSLIQP